MVAAVKVGSEFLVNTTKTGIQEEPSITSLANGNFVVTWTDRSETGGDASNRAIRAQVFQADGTAAGSEFLVNTSTNSIQDLPSITSLNNGNFVIAWRDYSTGGSKIRAQIFQSDGTSVGSEFQVFPTNTSTQADPAITSLNNGNFVVTWSNYVSGVPGDTSVTDIYARIFLPDGTSVGSEFLVNTTTFREQYFPSITTLSNGKFVITWRDQSLTGADTSSGAIRAQIFGADGTASGANFLVNTTTASTQYDPSVTALSNGSFVVTWTDGSRTGDDTSSSAIRGQIFGSDGNKTGTEFLVNSTTLVTQSEPTVTTLTDGNFVVSWYDFSDATGNIRAQVFSAAGSKVGTEFLVNTITTNSQSQPSITSLNDGNFVVTWRDFSGLNGAISAGIRAQVFKLDDNAFGGTSAGDALNGTNIAELFDITTGGDDTVSGGGGNDSILAGNAFNSSDSLDGGNGSDLLSLTGDVTATLGSGSLLNVEILALAAGGNYALTTDDATVANGSVLAVNGSALASANTLTWNGAAESDGGRFNISGGAGKDSLTGGGGGDSLSGGAGNDLISGGGGDDLISGGAGHDVLHGGGGNDNIVISAAGFDSVYGGAGNDTISADNMFDYTELVDGGSGIDILTLSGGFGGSIQRLTNVETISLADGATYALSPLNAVVANGATMTIDGSALTGTNRLSFNGSQETDGGRFVVSGGAAADSITGGAGVDILIGGGGNDLFMPGAGADTITGGAGADIVQGSLADLAGVTIADFTMDDQIIVSGADLSALNGTAAGTSINLGGGNVLTLDNVVSAGRVFSAVASGGNTTISLAISSGGGGSGGGTPSGASSGDTGSTGPGDTTGPVTVVISNGGATETRTTETGLDGIIRDTSSFSPVTTAGGALTTVTLTGNITTALPSGVGLEVTGPSSTQAPTTAQGELNSRISDLVSDVSKQADIQASIAAFTNMLSADQAITVQTVTPSITGGLPPDEPIALSAGTATGQEALIVDVSNLPVGTQLTLDNIEFVSFVGDVAVNLTGGSGSNYVVLGSAGDTCILGADDDTLSGGAGNDLVASQGGSDILYGNQGTDTVTGGADNDTLFGGQDQDLIYGNTAADVIYGNKGSDTLYGGQGDDFLYGGKDNDVVYGNKGNDTLNGNRGDDQLYGNDGLNTFAFSTDGGVDTINDYRFGDTIRIEKDINSSGIDEFSDLNSCVSYDGSGNAVLDLGNGNNVTMIGVDSSSLGDVMVEIYANGSRLSSGTLTDKTVTVIGTTDNNGGWTDF